jgi:hypothetical protein
MLGYLVAQGLTFEAPILVKRVSQKLGYQAWVVIYNELGDYVAMWPMSITKNM